MSGVEPQTSDLVTPNVRLVERIGEGGMGSVWLAHHLALDCPVAVKFMASELAVCYPDSLERFAAEARAAAQLRHPHVVQIFDFGTSSVSGELPYIIMELLEGEDLDEYLQVRGPLALREVVSIVRAVGSALEAAHARGIIHRDIKTQNIFLQGPERIPKVLDFGVAKTLLGNHRESRPGLIVGSPSSMSPEQVSGADVDHQCDLWALAVVAYVTLTGKQPFGGNGFTSTCAAILRGEFEPVSLSRHDVPHAVDAWFRRAFAKEAEHRFPSAKTMADAFARAVDGDEPVLPLVVKRARLSEVLERAEREPRQRRRVTTGASVAVLVAVLGLALVQHSHPRMTSWVSAASSAQIQRLLGF